jgi:hypothetical protein
MAASPPPVVERLAPPIEERLASPIEERLASPIEERFTPIEEVLDAFRGALADDHRAYRAHVYRVFHFCRALAGSASTGRDDGIALAAAFHDLGIWSDGTVDYLPPSARRVREHCERHGRSGEAAELARMVELHHKLTPCRGADDALVEAFRRADLVDLSFGFVRFGLPRAWVAEVQAAFPAAGFHLRVVQLVGGHALRHPLRPLPMMRL